jgi:hypothetical protein
VSIPLLESTTDVSLLEVSALSGVEPSSGGTDASMHSPEMHVNPARQLVCGHAGMHW